MRSHLLQRYVGHGGLQGLEGLWVPLGAVLVDQVLLQGGLHESVDHEPFRSGFDQDGMGCELGHIRDGRIDDHHLRFIDANRFFDAHGRERVCLRDVGANEYHGLGFRQVFPVVRAPPDPQGVPGGMHEVEVTVAGTAVELVGSEPGAHEFLEEIQFFVGAAGGDQTGNCVGPVLTSDFGKPLNHLVHGFEPGGFDELITFAKERLFHTCGAIDVLESKTPSHTEPAVPLGRVGPVAPFVLPGQRRGYADDFSVLGLKVHLTAVPAVVTRRRGFLHLPWLV